MMFPMIHLNGSSPERLLDDLAAAHDSLTQAVDALRRAAPNARDYYPLGALHDLQSHFGVAAHTVAVEEHDARLTKLREVIEQIDQLQAHVLEQVTR